jgi:hypothetical protein
MRRLLRAILLLLNLASCTFTSAREEENKTLPDQTVSLVTKVREFGKTIGIEPSEALGRASVAKPATSILWLWFQKFGTLALRAPIDIKTSVTFSAAKEQALLNRLYHTGGYSVYIRQGNQFGDARSVITPDFVDDSVLRKVEVVLHEDLHDNKNFALLWEHEESLVNALGLLAAVEFLKSKGDEANAKRAQALMQERRAVSREMIALTERVVQLFRNPVLDDARKTVFDLLPSYPAYYRDYERDVKGLQDIYRSNLGDRKIDRMLPLEAKISHDFAYYRYFDRVVALYERVGSLKTLIEELKQLNDRVKNLDVERPYGDSGIFAQYGDAIDQYLSELESNALELNDGRPYLVKR